MLNMLSMLFRCFIGLAMVATFLQAIDDTFTPAGGLATWLLFIGFSIIAYLQQIADAVMGLDRMAMLKKSFSDPFLSDAQKVAAKRAEADARAAQANAEA